jgi:hypothetical protein
MPRPGLGGVYIYGTVIPVPVHCRIWAGLLDNTSFVLRILSVASQRASCLDAIALLPRAGAKASVLANNISA